MSKKIVGSCLPPSDLTERTTPSPSSINRREAPEMAAGPAAKPRYVQPKSSCKPKRDVYVCSCMDPGSSVASKITISRCSHSSSSPRCLNVHIYIYQCCHSSLLYHFRKLSRGITPWSAVRETPSRQTVDYPTPYASSIIVFLVSAYVTPDWD